MAEELHDFFKGLPDACSGAPKTTLVAKKNKLKI